MRPDRSDYRNGVDSGGRQQLRGVQLHVDTRVELTCAFKPGAILVADCNDLAVFEALEISDHIRSPIAVTDDANTHEIILARAHVAVRTLRQLCPGPGKIVIPKGFCLRRHNVLSKTRMYCTPRRRTGSISDRQTLVEG